MSIATVYDLIGQCEISEHALRLEHARLIEAAWRAEYNSASDTDSRQHAGGEYAAAQRHTEDALHCLEITKRQYSGPLYDFLMRPIDASLIRSLDEMECVS